MMVRTNLRALSCAILAAAIPIAPGYAAAQPAGAAMRAVTEWYGSDRSLGCMDPQGQVVGCGSKNEHSFQIFYGNAHGGPGNPDAVAILTYQPDPTGNGLGSVAAYFRQTGAGYTFVRRLPGYNGISATPGAQARFGGGRVVIPVIYYKDSDLHCCPTGRRQVSLMLQ